MFIDGGKTLAVRMWGLEEKAIHGGVVCLIEVAPSKCGRVGQGFVLIKTKQNGDMVAGSYWRKGRHSGYEVSFAIAVKCYLAVKHVWG